MRSHCSGFKSHLHPSLASCMTSPCLIFYTSQTHDIFTLLGWGRGSKEQNLQSPCWSLKGEPDLKAILWYVQCLHVSVEDSPGKAWITGPLGTACWSYMSPSQTSLPSPLGPQRPSSLRLPICPDLSLLHHSFHRHLWRTYMCLALCWELRVNKKGPNLLPLVADEPWQTTTSTFTEAKLWINRMSWVQGRLASSGGATSPQRRWCWNHKCPGEQRVGL